MLTGCNTSNTSTYQSTNNSSNNEIQNVYESYKSNGGTLSYEEWLSSIKGEKGDTGPKGDKGEDGKSAYELYKEKHPEYQGSEDDWLNDLISGKLTKITISFDTCGGNSIDDYTTCAGSYISVNNPTRNGYEFLGWTLNGSDIDLNTYVFLATSTLKAKWKKVTYKITYITDGGINDFKNPSEYDIESEDIILLDAKKSYHNFEGWFTDSTYTNKITSIPKGSYGDLTLYAKYSTIKYTITYNLDGGTNSLNNPSEYDHYTNTIYLSEPTKDGYIFKGWYLDSTFETKIASIPSGYDTNLTLYAKWVAVGNYEITYELNGGTNNTLNPYTYNADNSDITLHSPTKEHCIFKGWYLDSTFTNPISVIEKGTKKDLILYAKWENTSYSISYHLNGGDETTDNPTSYTYFDNEITLKNAIRNGYTFEGWYSDVDFKNKTTSIKRNTSGDLNFYANWKANITYVLDDGTNDSKNPTSYETKDGNVTFKDATKDGYVFKGWYFDKDYSNKVTSINTNDYGNVTLYAKFISIDASLGKTVEISKDKTYATYGLYPTSLVSDSNIVSSLNNLTGPESNGYYLLNSEYYKKNSSSWYKCEPITWKIIENTNDKEYKLLSTAILDCYRFNESYENTNQASYYANNYANSEIHTWLNGTFYDQAFSLNNSYIQTTTIDNSSSTTKDSDNKYASDNTTDKVYLLSYQEYLKEDYGFSSSYEPSSTRIVKTTDYAKDKGVYQNEYWTRSPSGNKSTNVMIVNQYGSLQYPYDVSLTYMGVRPCISIKIS